VLRQCGDNLTRENILKQATNLKNIQLDLWLPEIVGDTRCNRLSGQQAISDDENQGRTLGGIWTNH
jgi:hypothetical protein